MALLITSTACSFLALAAAIILHFQLPPWLFLTGLTRLESEKRANIDMVHLRKSLSAFLYILASVFFAGAILLFFKVLVEGFILQLYFIVFLLFFNALYFTYRKLDHNTYSDKTHHSALFFFLLMNAIFLLLFFIVPR